MYAPPTVVPAAAPLAAHPYAPLLIVILGVMGIVAGILALTHLIGPRRHGAVKDDTYESGMPVIGDARRRFHVRFYLVAVMFLLFDVEIVFLWPWALVFHDAANRDSPAPADAVADPTFLAAGMAVFFLILVVGYVYDLGKGIFRWD